jgi:hypothetical protein
MFTEIETDKSLSASATEYVSARQKNNRNKNYAPINPLLKTLDPSDKIIDTNAIHKARQARRVLPQTIPNQLTLTPAALSLTQTTKTRQHNRLGFAKRTAGRFTVQTPFLNSYLTPNLSTTERLQMYNKRHKCQHGRWFNVIEPVFNNEKIIGYKVRCEHNDETLTDQKSSPCGNCASPLNYVVEKRGCICDITSCLRCKCTIYSYNLTPECPLKACFCCCGGNHTNDFKLNVVTKLKKPKFWKRITPIPEPVLDNFPTASEIPSHDRPPRPPSVPRKTNWKRSKVQPTNFTIAEEPKVEANRISTTSRTILSSEDFDKLKIVTQGGRIHTPVTAGDIIFDDDTFGTTAMMTLCNNVLALNQSYIKNFNIPDYNLFCTGLISEVVAQYSFHNTDFTMPSLLAIINRIFPAYCFKFEHQYKPPQYDPRKLSRANYTYDLIPIFNHFFFQANLIDLSFFTKKQRQDFIRKILDEFIIAYPYDYFYKHELTSYFDHALFESTLTTFCSDSLIIRQGGTLSSTLDLSKNIAGAVGDFIYDLVSNSIATFTSATKEILTSVKNSRVAKALSNLTSFSNFYTQALISLRNTSTDLYLAFCTSIFTTLQSTSLSSLLTTILLAKNIFSSMSLSQPSTDASNNPQSFDDECEMPLQPTSDYNITTEQIRESRDSYYARTSSSALGLDEILTQGSNPFHSFYLFFTQTLKFPDFLPRSPRFIPLVKDFNTICTSGKNILSILYAIIEFLPNFLRQYLCTFDSSAWMRSELAVPTSSFSQLTINAFACQLALNRGTDHTEFKRRAIVAQSEVLEQIRNERVNLDSRLSSTLKRLEDMIYAFEGITPRESEPFTIKISSPPGLGKSTFWPLFVSPILPNQTVEQIKNRTFVRNVQEEYWDGCISGKHDIVLYDDFNQSREERDLGEIISLVSTSVFMPPYSSNTKGDSKTTGVKGQTIGPNIVVLLSNITTVSPITLYSSEAVNRRKHIHIYISKPSPEHTSKDPSQYRYHYTTNPSSNPDTEITFAQLQSLIRQTYISFKQVRQQVKTDLNNLLYTETGAQDLVPLPVMTQGRSIRVQEGETEYQYLLRTARSMVDRFMEEPFKTIGFDFRLTSKHVAILSPIGAVSVTFKPFIALCVTVSASILAFQIFKKLYTPIVRQSGENANARVLSRPVIKTQSACASNVLRLCKNNIIKITRSNGDTLTGMFVSGRTFMTSGHILKSTTSDDFDHNDTYQIQFHTQEAPVQFTFDKTCLYKLGDKDVVLYRLGTNVAARRTLTHLFYKGDLSLNARSVGTVRYDGTSDPTIHYGKIKKDHLKVLYNPNMHTQSYLEHTVFSYDIVGQGGDCGSPVVIVDDLLGSHLIAGVHSGYNPRMHDSVGFLVTQDMVLEGIAHLDASLEKEITRTITQSSHLFDIDDSDILEAHLPGTTNLEFKLLEPITQNSKSSAIPSPLYGIVPPTTMNTILNPKDRRLPEGADLYRDQIRKYTHDVQPFTKSEIDEAMDSIYEELIAIPTVSLCRRLTEDEAINGVPGMPYLDPLNMTTSAGFPWCLDPNLRGEKRKLFTLTPENKYVISDPTLRELLDERTALARQGIMSNDCWIDTLKDERRPIEKVKLGKTRLFAASPCSFIIHSRSLFLCFVAHFYQCQGLCFSAVGIDKSSTEWNAHYLRLCEVSDVGFAGDYSNWDGSVLFDVLNAAYGLINRWYDDEYTLDRRTLAQEVGQARHLFHTWFYTVAKSLPSGIDLTVVINNLVNECGMRIAWTRLVPSPYNSFYYYRRYVRTSMYGDDNIVSVDRFFLTYFNQLTVTKFFSQYNITYTNADKTESSTEYAPLEELSFLKCKTNKLFGFYVPIMDEEANLETLNWITKCKEYTPHTLCENNCNSVLRNCFFSGAAYFNKIRNMILSVQPSYNLLTFTFLRNDFLSTGKISDEFNEFGFTKSASFRPPSL